MMSEVAQQVFDYLNALEIPYDSISHPPVATIADCAQIDAQLGSVTVKNYFLSTRNHKRRFLCLVRPNARFSSGDVSHQAGASRLSFGTEDELMALMHLRPGSVSPMGLMFDAQNKVELLVDSALPALSRLSFHPCDNRYTLAMRTSDFFERFLPAVRHAPTLVEINDFMT